jgi:hypothetical protein
LKILFTNLELTGFSFGFCLKRQSGCQALTLPSGDFILNGGGMQIFVQFYLGQG